MIVATENNWVYGLDATTGKINWSTSLGKPYAIKTCDNIAPNVGVTSTPVYDPSTGTVYVMAKSTPGSTIAWRLFGINVTTGAITFTAGYLRQPVQRLPHQLQRPQQELQRPGLLLLNGWVYAAFSSHCDHKPYAGYVAAVDLANGNSTLWTDESGATNDQAGIWQSGGGLMSDGPGRIILTSGNGISPRQGSRQQPARPARRVRHPAGAAVRRHPGGAGLLQPGQRPDPRQPMTSTTAPPGRPNCRWAPRAYPHVIVQGGKIGHIFLLDANNLGGREQGPGGSDKDLYQSQPYGGLWGHPAVFEQSTSPIPPNSSRLANYVYTVGKKDYVRAFRIDTNGSGVPKLTDVANSTFQFPYGSGSPVVTSNGNDPTSAVVWVVQNNGGSNSTLVAFPAVPQPAKGGGVKLQEIRRRADRDGQQLHHPGHRQRHGLRGHRGTVTSSASGSPRGPRCSASATPAFGTTAVGSVRHPDRHRDRVADRHRDRHQLLRRHLTRPVHHRPGDRDLSRAAPSRAGHASRSPCTAVTRCTHR